MRALTLFLVIAPLCLAWAGLAQPVAPQAVPADVLAQAGLRYYWTLQLSLDEDETVLRLTRLDENIYCLTSNYRLVALDAAKGLQKWSYQVAEPGQTVFEPTHVNNLKLTDRPTGIKEMLTPTSAPAEMQPFNAVVINTLSYVLVLDRQTGKLYRNIPLDFAANTTGICDGTYFYAGSTEGQLYAMLIGQAIKAWMLSANDMITAPIRFVDGRIYFADESGTVQCASAGIRGTKVWSQQLNGPISAPFYVDARGCFVPCDDHRLYAFEATTGARLWERPFLCQRPLRDAPQVGERTIFQLADPEMFYAIDLVTGVQRWSMAEGREVLGMLGGEIYLLGAGNQLMIVDEMTGSVRTSLPMTGWDLFSPSATGSEIFTASKGGKVACIREQAAGRLTSEMLK